MAGRQPFNEKMSTFINIFTPGQNTLGRSQHSFILSLCPASLDQAIASKQNGHQPVEVGIRGIYFNYALVMVMIVYNMYILNVI